MKDYITKIETNHGTALISIPSNADVDDLLMVREVLDIVLKRRFKLTEHDIDDEGEEF